MNHKSNTKMKTCQIQLNSVYCSCNKCEDQQEQLEKEIFQKEKLYWKKQDEWKAIRKEMAANEAAARRRRDEEERSHLERERIRKAEERRRFTAKSETEFQIAMDNMNSEIYFADCESLVKKQRNHQRFQNRRRKTLFKANELTIREDYIKKMQVSYKDILI